MTLRKEETKTKLFPVYFLHGPEDYLIEEECRRLLDQTLGPRERGFNCHLFSGEEDHAPEILRTARTLPMFSAHRFVLIRRADLFDPDDIESLLPYLQNPSPSTRLVMTGQSLGPWKTYQRELERHGKVVEYPRLKGVGLISWVRRRMEERGKSLSEEGARYLIEVVGDHLQDLDNALERLYLSVGEKGHVDLSDAEEINPELKVSTIYDLTEAIGEKNLRKALSILDKAMETKTIPLRREEPVPKRMDDPTPLLLDRVARHFWNLLRAKTMAMEKKELDVIAEALSLRPWAAKKVLDQGRRFSISSLREAILRCHQTDLALKQGKGEKVLLLEKLVIDLCLSRPGEAFEESRDPSRFERVRRRVSGG